MLYLSADDVRQSLPMPDAIDAMRNAFEQLSDGQVDLPVRQCLDAAGETGVALVMPCHSNSQQLFSVKVATVFHGNRQRDLPSVQSLLILTDAETGKHLAVMDGASVTAIRTGAASGVATDLLARSDARVVAVLGAGVQARTQLKAVCCVRSIRRAQVFAPSATAAEQFANEMSRQIGIPVQHATSPAEALRDADIVCAATSSKTPVFDDSDLSPGVHINGVGSYRCDMVEIPAATVCRARVVVDHRESALEEAGDLISPLDQGLIQPSHISTELGEILLGRSPGRKTADETTFFKSVGVAIQDLSAAALALENAQRLGLGVSLR